MHKYLSEPCLGIMASRGWRLKSPGQVLHLWVRQGEPGKAPIPAQGPQRREWTLILFLSSFRASVSGSPV